MRQSIKIMKFFMALFAIAITFSAIGLGAYDGAFAIAMTAPLILASIETSSDAKKKRFEIYEEMGGLIQRRKEEKRDWTEDEEKRYQILDDNYEKLTKHIEVLEKDEERTLLMVSNKAKHQRKSQDEKDLEKFSLARLIKVKAEGRSLDGIEAEMHQEAEREARDARISLQGVGIPDIAIRSMLAKRDAQSSLNVTGGTEGDQGGLLVPTVLSGLIMALRPMLVLSNLGVDFMGGLRGNYDLPRGQSTVATFVDEEAEAGLTLSTFEKITMSPKRMAAYTRISNQLLIQSADNIEQTIINDLFAAIAQKLEEVAINGNGEGNNPLGLLNVNGIGSVEGGAEGAAPTWGHMVALEKEVAIKNALMGRLAYLTNHKVKAKLKTTKLDTGSGLFVWPHNENNINGYPVGVSNLVPSNLEKTATDLSAIIFGDWSKLLIGQWGGLDLKVDELGEAIYGRTRIITNSYWDVKTRWPEKFAAMTDVITGADDES